MCGASGGGVEPGVASEPPSQPHETPSLRRAAGGARPPGAGAPALPGPSPFFFLFACKSRRRGCSQAELVQPPLLQSSGRGRETPSPPATPLKPQTAAPTQHTLDLCSFCSPPNPSSLQCLSLLGRGAAAEVCPRGVPGWGRVRSEALAAGTHSLADSSFLRWGWGADPGASAPERAPRCGCGEPGPGVGVRHPERGNGLKSRGAVLPSLGTGKFTLLAPTFRGPRQSLERGPSPPTSEEPSPA